jgi:hypothetical protein
MPVVGPSTGPTPVTSGAKPGQSGLPDLEVATRSAPVLADSQADSASSILVTRSTASALVRRLVLTRP